MFTVRRRRVYSKLCLVLRFKNTTTTKLMCHHLIPSIIDLPKQFFISAVLNTNAYVKMFCIVSNKMPVEKQILKKDNTS